jgi:hypothetical protein
MRMSELHSEKGPDWESLYHAAIYAAEIFEDALEKIACNCSSEDCCDPEEECFQGIASHALSEVKNMRLKELR